MRRKLPIRGLLAFLVGTGGAVRGANPTADAALPDENALVTRLLGEAPVETVGEPMRRLEGGDSPVALAEAVVTAATRLSWRFLAGGGDPRALLATLGRAVLREDAGFHEFQQLDLAWRRLMRRGDGPASHLALTATARWIAAHDPPHRARDQTFPSLAA